MGTLEDRADHPNNGRAPCGVVPVRACYNRPMPAIAPPPR
ncbi:hypothetical protein PAI11_16380 [Patulibacter medicamentivorans]|uniref:Uncharacterized protein n=1 Tax=Patulibacter medicamentivorans TaxID=1097667 RepID=H0E4B1_9ACTN|nr:hypothetical protein PAI11_16380 [Patulibacter medicamentivorans]